VQISAEDRQFLEQLLATQATGQRQYPVKEEEFRRLVVSRVRGATKDITVTVPTERDPDEPEVDVPAAAPEVRESTRVQALLAEISAHDGRSGYRETIVKQPCGREGERAPMRAPAPNDDDVTLRTRSRSMSQAQGPSHQRAFGGAHDLGLLESYAWLICCAATWISGCIVAPAAAAKVSGFGARSFFDRGPLSSCSLCRTTASATGDSVSPVVPLGFRVEEYGKMRPRCRTGRPVVMVFAPAAERQRSRARRGAATKAGDAITCAPAAVAGKREADRETAAVRALLDRLLDDRSVEDVSPPHILQAVSGELRSLRGGRSPREVDRAMRQKRARMASNLD
jgi:hypothetical protein